MQERKYGHVCVHTGGVSNAYSRIRTARAHVHGWVGTEKQHRRQEEVWKDVIAQRVAGNIGIAGLMVESYLEEGNQKFPQPIDQLKRGVSITDACINWETTERL